MEATLSQQRILPAIAVSAVGIAVSSVIHTPFGLLAPAVALFLFASGRTGLLLHVASATGLVGSLLVAAFYQGEARDLAVVWAAFFALAICIGALVATRTSASPSAEAMPAMNRSMRREETQSSLALGPTLKEKVAPRNSPFVSIAAADDQATATQMVAASFWGGTPFHIRYWRRLTDGNHRWTEIRTELLHEAGGRQQWTGISADIDDSKPAPPQPTKTASNPPNDDDAVRAAKVVERLLGNAWAFDAAGRPTYLTPMAQTFVAVTLEEFQAAVDEGHTVFKRTSHPDEYDRIATAWRHSLKTGEPFYIERRIRRATGIHDWTRTAIVPTRDSQGRVTGWYGASVDLDAYRHAEVELRERERELLQLVNMVPSHLWRLTPDGEPIFFNKRMVDFLGLDVADMDRPGTSRLEAMIEAVHTDDAAEFRDTLRRCLVTGESFAMQYRLRRADGVYRWMSSRAEAMRDQNGRIVQWYGLCHDIDDQVHAEEALRRSERALRELIDVVPVAIGRLGPDGDPTFFNKRMIDVLGLDVTDMEKPGVSRLAAAIAAVLHPDDAVSYAEALNHSLVTGEPFSRKYRLRHADGVYRWMEGRAEPLRDQDGKIVQWYGVSLDIDNQMHAEEALRRSERQLQQLIDAIPVHFWSATPAGLPSYMNKRAQEYLGINLADFEPLDQPGNAEKLRQVVFQKTHPNDAPENQRRLAHSFKTGERHQMRFRRLAKDGVYRWVEGRMEPHRDHEGNILQWCGVSIDIDEEVRAQEALRRSERQLQQLVDAVPVMIWSTTPEGRPSYVNKRFTDITGATLEDITAPDGSFNLSVIHPDDRAATAEMVGHSFTTGIPYVIQYRQLRRDGAYHWTETRAEALRDETGAVLQWYGVSVDIDDQVRLYSDIEEREAKIRRLVDSDIIGIVIWDLDGRLIDANDAFLRMVQCDREDLQAGLRWFDMTPPEWQDVHAREEAEELKTTGKMQAREKEFFRKDGSRVPVLIGAACFEGQSRQGVAYILDLTERKRAEAALRDRERELSQLVDMVPVHIRRLTPQGEPTFFNKRLRDFFGLDVVDLDNAGTSRLATAMKSLVHPDDRDTLLEMFRQSLVTGERYSGKYRMRRADGAYCWVDTRAEPLRDENGAIVQWYVVSIDIDDEVRAQEALREREQELSQLVNVVPAHIRRLTPEGEPIFFNKRLKDFYGLGDVSDLDKQGMSRLSATIQTLVHADDATSLLTTARRSFAAGEPFSMKYRTRRADGVYRWVDTRTEPLRNQSGAIVHWYVISIDIDDEVRAQEALRLASDKLAKAAQAASLAELSASIAHEVNQPLAAIAAYSHACQRWLGADPPNLERAQLTVERIIRDVNSAAEVVSRIRALFRQAVEPRNTTTLASIITEARNLMTEEATRRHIRIEEDIESDLPPIAFDRVQLQQVLINLIGNGMDAMDASAGDKVLRIRVRRIGDTVRTEISDRGQGIDFPDKIFDPFFTTKEHGMGMGLAICRSIVESHGGRLWAENNKPHGATFIFTLPIELPGAP